MLSRVLLLPESITRARKNNYYLFSTYYVPGRGDSKNLTTCIAQAPAHISEQMLAVNPGVAGLALLLKISMVPGTVLRDLGHHFIESSKCQRR